MMVQPKILHSNSGIMYLIRAMKLIGEVVTTTSNQTLKIKTLTLIIIWQVWILISGAISLKKYVSIIKTTVLKVEMQESE